MSDAELTCTASAHAAATLAVVVTIPGLGQALGDFSFQYLVSFSAVTPTTTVSYGGADVTIHGIGFGFLAAAAQTLASAAYDWAFELVGYNAVRPGALLHRTARTTPRATVQLHGVGAEVEYLGCYYDDGDMLPVHLSTMARGHFSVQKCLAECGRRGYIYAALNRGRDCRCGNGYGPSVDERFVLKESAEQVIAANGEQKECRMGCSGAKDVYSVLYKGWSCGGFERSAVYTRATNLTCTPEVPGAEAANLSCRVPPLFTTVDQLEGANAAYADQIEVCENPSDTMDEKICWMAPRGDPYAPSSITNHTYALAIAGAVCSDAAACASVRAARDAAHRPDRRQRRPRRRHRDHRRRGLQRRPSANNAVWRGARTSSPLRPTRSL